MRQIYLIFELWSCNETVSNFTYAGLFSNKELKEIAVSIQNYGISLYHLERKTTELMLDAAEKNEITIYDGAQSGVDDESRSGIHHGR